MMAQGENIRNRECSVEANMGQARKWVSVALAGLVAASLSLVILGPALAGEAGTEVTGWDASGSVEAGGIYSFGERGSSKFNQYRDMDNGFVGELTLRGEKKDQPYFFELGAKNPARDDQKYDGAFGRYGLFQLDLGWDRTPHVLSNDAQTIFQQNGSVFTLPSTSRPLTTADAQSTINSLTRHVDLSFNTDAAQAEFKFTPTEEWRFDLGYENIRRQGYRPLGTVIGSPGGSPTELAIPIENMTQDVKFGAEYAREGYALQFGYTASIFQNDYNSYTWDNPGVAAGTANALGQVSAPPDNYAHTFNLTGSAALPLRSRVSGTFAYSMLRQDQNFIPNTASTGLAHTSTDDAGNGSPDAKANLILGNIQLTSRPIMDVTTTVRYRYFEYQNDTPEHIFSACDPEATGSATTCQTKEERYTKQNAGGDIGWRPLRWASLKGGYEFEHWNRGDFASHSSDEHTGKFSADMTPIDWFLGRVTYSYSQRSVQNYEAPEGQLPQFVLFDQADRRRNKVDLLLQFSPWETVTPSATFSYAKDDYNNSTYGLKKDDYLAAGASLGWSPLDWLQFSADYTFEYYKYNQQSRYRPVVGTTTYDFAANDWESDSEDFFHTVGVNADFNVIPKKLKITAGYAITFGQTKIDASNLGTPTLATTGSASNLAGAQAVDWPRVDNVLQTVKVVARYFFTQKLSARLGYAYERYTERNFALDPMQPYMGNIDSGAITPFLGATQPNYEAHILSLLLKYAF